MAEARGLRRRFVTRVDVEDAARAGVGITLGPTDVLTDEARSRARDLRVVVTVGGAVYRPVHGARRGAARTVTAGGGYWSQPSAVGVIGGDRPDAVEIQWPDGKTGRWEVAPNTRELRMPHPAAAQ